MSKQLIIEGIIKAMLGIKSVSIYDLDDDVLEKVYFDKCITYKLLKILLSNLNDITIELSYKNNTITIYYEFEKSNFFEGYNKSIIFEGYKDIKFTGMVQNYIKKEGVK